MGDTLSLKVERDDLHQMMFDQQAILTQLDSFDDRGQTEADRLSTLLLNAILHEIRIQGALTRQTIREMGKPG